MSTGWKIFQGDGRVKDVSFPPPPPWRNLTRAADHRGKTYRPTEREVDMVNAALHLRRPLLVEGPPGSGKSSLVYAVARELELGPVLHWPINARSTLREGLYRYDAVGRMSDKGCQIRNAPGVSVVSDEDIGDYLVLGPLGTALVPSERPRALLIDEIDKSDVDLPNDLLHVLENGWFEIAELVRVRTRHPRIRVLMETGEGAKEHATTEIVEGRVQATAFPFVVITSNGERELPPAFLRRCVRHSIEKPDELRLRQIVEAHLGSAVEDDQVVRLIGSFLDELNQETPLAMDQLLNAVFLLTSPDRPSDMEWSRVQDAILRSLREA